MSANGGGSGAGSGGPDWSGLLKWSLAQTDPSGAATPLEQRRQLSEEERRWFYEAMESMVVNEGDQLKQGLLILSQPLDGEGSVDAQRRLEALEDVEDLVAQIDLAKTFVKWEGMEVLLRLATNGRAEARLRAAALSAAATCLDHNPEAQEDFLKRKGVEKVLDVVVGGDDAADFRVKAKAVRALGASVRHNKKAFVQFLYAAGLGILLLSLKQALQQSTGSDGKDEEQQQQQRVVFVRKSFRLLEYVTRESRVKFERTIPQVEETCLEGACELVAMALGEAGRGDLEAREAALSFFRECLLSDRDAMREKSAGEGGGGVVARLREAAAGEEREDEIQLAKEALGMLA